MRSESQWLTEYKRTHTHPLNTRLHLFCVPLIFWSITAALWSLPSPFAFSGFWAFLGVALVLLFYFSLSAGAGMRMLTFSALCLAVDAFVPHLPIAAVAVFVLAWGGQFLGHHFEGAKPAFFDDLVFLLIGPLWALRKLE